MLCDERLECKAEASTFVASWDIQLHWILPLLNRSRYQLGVRLEEAHAVVDGGLGAVASDVLGNGCALRQHYFQSRERSGRRGGREPYHELCEL